MPSFKVQTGITMKDGLQRVLLDQFVCVIGMVYIAASQIIP